MSWESNSTGSTGRRKTFPCLVTFQRNVFTTSNALLLNNNCKIQPLSVPQPQINPASAVAQCWEGSSSSFPVMSAALQRSSSSIPGQSLIQPWLQGCVQDSRNQAATISCAGKHAACAAQTAPDGYCLDTGSTLALPPLTRCY